MSHLSLLVIGANDTDSVKKAMLPYNEQDPNTTDENAKWDYYDIREYTTIKDIKKKRQDYIAQFNTNGLREHYIMLWLKAKHYSIEAKQTNLLNQDACTLIDIFPTEESYVRYKHYNMPLSNSVIDKDGWHEPKEISMQATKEFEENYFRKFIEPYPDNTPVAIIEYHV